MFGGMILNTPTITLLVALVIIVVCCVAFPKVRRTLMGVVDALDGIEALVYIVFGLAFVSVVSWAMVYGLWKLLSGLL
jgi:hypothetical protein